MFPERSQEIRKLEQEAMTEERKLEEAERQLELDAAKFDNFLKENDRLAVDAIKQVRNSYYIALA